MKTLLLSLTLAFAAMTSAQADEAPAVPHFTREEAQAQIWAKEQAIYGDRARGTPDSYINATAEDYSSWPPGFPAPVNVGNLRAARAGMAGNDKEQLEMEFVHLSLNGDTAVIYYRTHRTRLANGDPADDRFEVTHTWIHKDGEWQVLGGLARKIS